MRIISGIYRGRNIVLPRSFKERPTTNFAKTALFNIISGQFNIGDTNVLDLFAGTGCITYEFASRECKHVDCVEINGSYCMFIQKTTQLINMPQVMIHRQDAFAYIKRCQRKYDIIFADPPYNLDDTTQLPDMIFEQNMLNENGCFILEHGSDKKFEAHKCFLQQRRYGSVNFSMFAQRRHV